LITEADLVANLYAEIVNIAMVALDEGRNRGSVSIWRVPGFGVPMTLMPSSTSRRPGVNHVDLRMPSPLAPPDPVLVLGIRASERQRDGAGANLMMTP
jgi:hypothetical protein